MTGAYGFELADPLDQLETLGSGHGSVAKWQPPLATYRRAPRLELGRVLVDPAAAPSLAAHDGCPSESPSWTRKNHEVLPDQFFAMGKDTRVSGCPGSCPDLAFRCAHELLIDRRLARFDRSFEFESWYFTA